MARCLPYPPPLGYLRDFGARGEASVSRFIIKKENGKSVTENCKEKKRREKEGRRKDRKENKEEKTSCGEGKGCCTVLPNRGEEEIERSDLTEEHGQPVCYLSDGAHGINKRKRDEAIETAPNGTKRRNIIRIRLPSNQNKEPNVSLGEPNVRLGGQQSAIACSFPQTKDVFCMPDQEQWCFINSKTETNVRVLPSRAEKAPHCAVSERIETFAQDDSASTLGTMLHNENHTIEPQYKVLIEDWVPPTLQFELEDSDVQEWLFGGQKQEKQGSKRSNACNDACCSGVSTLYPSARLLPEVNIYALPYTIPF